LDQKGLMTGLAAVAEEGSSAAENPHVRTKPSCAHSSAQTRNSSFKKK